MKNCKVDTQLIGVILLFDQIAVVMECIGSYHITRFLDDDSAGFSYNELYKYLYDPFVSINDYTSGFLNLTNIYFTRSKALENDRQRFLYNNIFLCFYEGLFFKIAKRPYFKKQHHIALLYQIKRSITSQGDEGIVHREKAKIIDNVRFYPKNFCLQALGPF